LDIGACFDAGEDVASRFCWLTADAVPARFDLRSRGWELSGREEPGPSCVGIFHAAKFDSMGWIHVLSSLDHEARRYILVAGVEHAHQRATLLHIGFGEAVPPDISMDEYAARAGRIAESGQWLPRAREIGALKLDLLAREAFGFDKPLNLNPREFALLWRLSDNVGHVVPKQLLVQDVWRMGFVPETNSIAVHMSRLRRKLSFVGLARMVETSVGGGYRLRPLSDLLNEGTKQPRSRRDGLNRAENRRQATA
jgi:DNA-binding response OmpR family regulator